MRSTVATAACLAVLAMTPIGGLAATTLRSTPADPAPRHEPVGEPHAGPAAGSSELLAVRINEVAQADDVLAVRLPTQRLAVPVEALSQWHIRRPAARLLRVEGRDHIELDAIPGARWHIDSATQTLLIDLPSAAFLRNDFEVVSQLRPAQAVARLGAFMNYDLHWQREAVAGGGSTGVLGGLIELGAFSTVGNGRSTGVWRRAEGFSGYTRLDTNWNIDLPQALSSIRIGDAIGTAGAWGRSVRFGGVQWATNFAVQPGLISFPMPAVRGEANVPSIVDLYVNNTHQLQGKVPPGGFDLPDVPVITGAGQIKMVVRDLLGREQVIVSQYYVSPLLLRAGLHDFALEAGTVREDYGIDSMHYGRAMITATDRQGVSDTFTRELRGELLRDQQTVGASGVWLVKQLATANFSAAASRSPAGAGWLAATGIDHQAAAWSAGLQARTASRHFTQIGQARASDAGGAPQTARTMISANVATSFANGGVGVNVLQQSTWQGDRYRSMSVNYGRSVGLFGYLSIFASRTTGSSTGTSIGINLIQSLGGNASASVSSYRSRDRPDASSPARDSEQHVVQVQGTAPVGPGFGYQVLAQRGSYDRAAGDLTWQTERMAFSAGAAQNQSGASYRAGMSGAVAVMPEGVFTSRRIDGSFAVVQVGDYEGIRVNRDNQFVARTDSHGRAFVHGLRGFESNRISVEGADLPLDAQVDDLHVAVVPGIGSGVSVRFPVRRTRAATLRLVMLDGNPVPAGSWVRIHDAKADFPVGLDGRLFLAGLGDRTAIRAEWEGRHCSGEVVLAPDAEAVPELGTVLCR